MPATHPTPSIFRSAGRLALILACVAASSAACVRTKKLTREFTRPSDAPSLDAESPYLKAHMLDGRVYVLSDWRVRDDLVSGSGELLDVNRRVEADGRFRFSTDSVAIFETNRISTSPYVVSLGVITAISVGVTAFCISSPKSCFGSCPTFYVDDGEGAKPQAEGFSASVSPALEATDIDALYRARPAGKELQVRMTNEALETHVVRHVDLLAAPRPANGRVFVTQGGEFRAAARTVPPTLCRATEGDCLEAVRAFDDIERFSLADSIDLATREVIHLEFPAMPVAELGLVIASRQTFLTTYLFYQALAYMGSSTATWLAALERGDAGTRELAQGIGRALGGIEVLLKDRSGGWTAAGALYETGPLATDVRIVPLGFAGGSPLRIRLRLTRGLWRLDWIGLAVLGEAVEPKRLRPARVLRDGVADERAHRLLLDPMQPLTTLPGDEYTLVYTLPADGVDYELFLESRGYYLEWMREEWLAEEDPARAAMMLLDPAGALRALAPEFKRVEPHIEALFWRSRYVRP